jgi:hypothetical protein
LQEFNFGSKQDTTFTPVQIDVQDEGLSLSDNDVLVSKPEIIQNSVDVGEPNRIGNGNRIKTMSSVANTRDNKLLMLSEEENPKFVPIEKDGRFFGSIARVEKNIPSEFELPQMDIKVEEVSYFAVSELTEVKDKSGISWNTNVNVGSGNFNPNSEITETPLFSTVSTLNNPGTNARTIGEDISSTNSQERAAVEDLSSAPMQGNISFTFGLNFGVILSDKWNIKSGVQYGAYRSSSSSSTVLRDRNSDELFPYHGASSSTEISDGRVINVTSEYDLYNDLQILTIPLMASYKVIDRKFDVSVVAGLSADFIISNTIRGGSEEINEVKFNQNDRQSYRNIFASSMAGLEVSYPFADKYAVSVMPTYKRALSNITTENATFNSMPAFVGLNMSLTYMF